MRAIPEQTIMNSSKIFIKISLNCAIKISFLGVVKLILKDVILLLYSLIVQLAKQQYLICGDHYSLYAPKKKKKVKTDFIVKPS